LLVSRTRRASDWQMPIAMAGPRSASGALSLRRRRRTAEFATTVALRCTPSKSANSPKNRAPELGDLFLSLGDADLALDDQVHTLPSRLREMTPAAYFSSRTTRARSMSCRVVRRSKIGLT
jgi:hypothetical protein